MIPGIEVSDGVRSFTVAPMNLRIMLCEPTKEYVDRISQGVNGDPASFNDAAVNLILACAQRNQPSLKREDVLEAVDAADLGPLVVQVMTKSGMTPRPLMPATTPSPRPEPASSDSSSAQPGGTLTTS